MGILLRSACAADIPILAHWDTKPHVIACTGSDDAADWHEELVQQEADWLDILIAECDGREVGVVQIIDPDKEVTQYWGDIGPGFRAVDIWIGEEADLGRGYGTQIMHLAHGLCFQDEKVRAVVLDPLVSNTRAHKFYERLGYRRIGRRMFGDDDCYVYRLDRQVWQSGKSTGQ